MTGVDPSPGSPFDPSPRGEGPIINRYGSRVSPLPSGRTGPLEALAPVAWALWRRPGLWPSALATLWRMAEPGWWSRPPYVPLPARGLWEFRMTTAYGSPDAVPVADDIVSYLTWCRSVGWTSRCHRHGGRRRRPAMFGASGQG